MTADELRIWQRRCGLRRDIEAAAALGLAVSTYRRKRSGRSPISRHTELLAAYYEIFSVHWLSVAEAAYRLAHITAIPVAPAAVAKVAEVITKIISPVKNGR